MQHFFNNRSIHKESSKICFNKFEANLSKLWIFLKHLNKSRNSFLLNPKIHLAHKHWVHPLQCTRTRCHAGPSGQWGPPIGRTRAEAVVDRQFLTDDEVADDEVTTTTLSSPVHTRRGNQVKQWWREARLAMDMAERWRGSSALGRLRPNRGTRRHAWPP
jgi:hypothetical protein